MMQEQFYHSKAWRRLSRAFLCSKNYICERCGNPAEIAHHKKHLNQGNLLDPNISLNAALLEALCTPCHNTEHYGAGGAVVRGLEFTPEGDLRKGQSQ